MYIHRHICKHIDMKLKLIAYSLIHSKNYFFPYMYILGEMSRGFRTKLADPLRNVPGHGVLSDSAFPVSGDMFGRIMTPLKDGDLLRAHPWARPALLQFSNAITSMRQSTEWGMGAVCKVNRILNNRLSWNQSKRGRLLNILHKLYNYRVRTTGISEIKNYFDT
jgi:hypothetical protein